jgi:hypothetical protein
MGTPGFELLLIKNVREWVERFVESLDTKHFNTFRRSINSGGAKQMVMDNRH